MTPGPNLIYRCGECQGLFYSSTISSGNTFGAKVRSDGKVDAPMLPHTPPLVACPHCDKPFCMIDSKPEDEWEIYPSGMGVALITNTLTDEMMQRLAKIKTQRKKYANTPKYKVVSSIQCLEFLNNKSLPKEMESELRVYAWHLFNDERMKSGAIELSELAALNLQTLLGHLEPDDTNQALTRSEMLRELGRFPEAAAALDHDFDSSVTAKAEQLMQAIERQDAAPFMFAETDRDGSNDYSWAWDARRYSPELPAQPATPLDPPIFHIGNRDWWVKVLGMLSHNWALLETSDDGKTTVYFFHDQGTTLGRSPYSYKQVRGRSAVVDSLQFDSPRAARMALARNSFARMLSNPGPWIGMEPVGHFYDARPFEEGVYSKKGYWEN